MLFTVREVCLGKYCARGLEYAALTLTQERGHMFFQIWTDLGRKKTRLRSCNKSVRVRVQDPKIPSAAGTIRLHDLKYSARSRTEKKKLRSRYNTN